MRRDAILNLPLNNVLRQEIALPLQVLGVYTIGQFLLSWRNPAAQPDIAAIFDSPQQARHAVAVCANWLGGRFAPVMQAGFTAEPWWRVDDQAAGNLRIAPASTAVPPASAAA